MGKISITVTREHWTRATHEVKRDGSVSECCPVALAFHDAGYPDVTIGVRHSVGYVINEVNTHVGVLSFFRSPLPEVGVAIATAFDSGPYGSVPVPEMLPATFEVETWEQT